MKDTRALLSAVQAELKPIPKNDKNPHFNSDFLNLSGVSEVVLPLLAKHGLSVTGEGCLIEGKFYLKLVLSAGQDSEKVESIWPVFNEKGTGQGQGSGTTYARRYALMALVGATATDDDDDGQKAEGKPPVAFKNNAPLPNYAPFKQPEGGSLGDTLMPFGKNNMTPLKMLNSGSIKSAVKWAKEKGKFVEFVQAAEAYLSEKELNSEMPRFDEPMPGDRDEQIPF